jgi:hypothetical protein
MAEHRHWFEYLFVYKPTFRYRDDHPIQEVLLNIQNIYVFGINSEMEPARGLNP